MARSDLLLDLVEAERRGDRNRFRTLVEAVIAEERGKQHHLLADRLSELITTVGTGTARDDRATAVRDLVQEIVPQRRLGDLDLTPVSRRVVDELIEEQKRSELLRSYGIEPRNRILLSGPPGNGKTSVAEAVAAELMLPFYVIRYEGIVSWVRQLQGWITPSSLSAPVGVYFSSTSLTPSPRNAPTSMRPGRSNGWFQHCCCRSTGCPPTSSS